MEGYLKKWTSIFRGYQDRWVMVTTEGYIQYYEKEPEHGAILPKGRLYLSMAELVRKDSRRFRVIASDGQSFYFKASTDEEADNWVQSIEGLLTKEGDLLDVVDEILDEVDAAELHTRDSDEESTHEEDKISLRSRKFHSFKDVAKTIMTEEQITGHLRSLMIDRKRKNFRVVVSIDLGSSSTGCAFSFKSEYKKDPLKIHTVILGEGHVRNHKEPTILLLNPDGEFDSFGCKAEEKYTELEQTDREAAKDWYYFSHFKMQLYNNKDLTRLIKSTDMTGKSMKAIDVFALCIEYIKDKALNRVHEYRRDVAEYEIRWALSCPAMWNESARQFMIDAAEKGGIDKRNITLVLDPEAAAICCQFLEKRHGLIGHSDKIAFSPGSRFLIIDLGGGAVDVTANEVLETNQIREIYNASGGPWGGNMINRKLWILLYDVFGHAVIQNFKENAREDYLNMDREIELRKRSVDFESKFVIDIPETLLNEAKALRADISYDKNRDLVRLKQSKIEIDPKLILHIFKESINTLCRHISNLLRRDETSGVSSILLVGGYSSCELLRTTIKETFPDLQLLCPTEPDMIIYKGAVIMGHMNTPISKRIARFHYGIAVIPEIDFAKSFDGITLRQMHDFVPQFRVFITKGSPIKVNDVISEYDIPVYAQQERVVIEVYASDKETPPELVSEDHCRKVGSIRIKLSGINTDSMLRVGVSCDGTEFKAIARDYDTGRCFAGICRFLE